MQSRLKTFFIFAAICIVPLLIIAILSFAGNLKFAEGGVEVDLEEEVSSTRNNFDALVREREVELRQLANSSPLRAYLANQYDRESSDSELPYEVREVVSQLFRGRQFYGPIGVFSKDARPLFIATPSQSGTEVTFQTKDFPPNLGTPDKTTPGSSDQLKCKVVSDASLGDTIRCTIPMPATTDHPNGSGSIVADVVIASLVAASSKRHDLRHLRLDQSVRAPSTFAIVLNDAGTIVYHANDALKHQPVTTSIPSFAPVAGAMMEGQSGVSTYESSDGDQWLAAYAPLLPPKLSLAVARDYSLATRRTRMFGWLGILAALLIGLGAAALLSTIYLKQMKSISAVAQGADAIAQGKLDHRIDLRSSDNLRPIADNLGLVTKQLRDQIAREAESRQFQSFIRLSAVLTHDLKNAIGTLSMLVTNMERHADNPEFRADAMKSLTGTTEKLNSLVARLSNPGSTLSGEHKRPRAIDIVPMLKRVTDVTAGPLREQHEIILNLPDSLYALVDIERMDKVVENLIINAIEALDAKRGKLTIAAGDTADGRIFFSVSDNGPGMSPRFVEERLFHPFATTKRRGVGLGLYTCREVVRANGGSIEVESKEGAGTTFRVVLPSPQIDDVVKK